MSSQKNKPKTVSDLMTEQTRTKPAFIETPNMDQVVDVVLRLAMELSVVRDRMDIHEKLAEKNGYGGADEIEAYQADEELTQHQSSRREKLIQRILHDLSS